MKRQLGQVLEELLVWLRFQRDSGVDLVDGNTLRLLERVNMTARMKNRQTKAPNPHDLERVDSLSMLKGLVENCHLCDLSKTRKKVVFGEGNHRPLLMIIGEAPGREEDLEGRPFVGRSGELLTKMLRAINIERQEVFITSVVKCRPPGNRTPVKEEILSCLPYLKRQIAILSPKLILCLGGVAAQALLDKQASLSSLRGEFHDYTGIKVAVTYHPAYLLRFGGLKQKDLKRRAWHDLQMVQKEYERLR